MRAGASARRHVLECMGTVFSFDIRAPGVDAAGLEEAIDWLHWVDAVFSPYRPNSAVNRLGRGECRVGKCPPEVGEVLERCAQLGEETDGYFSARYSQRLDPSGYVKGWAIERASDILVRAGSVNHCVNGGGDLQCAGRPGHGQPWRVGIAHPLQPGNLAGVAVGSGFAIATSGSAERGNHVIDPHTSRPVRALASITLVGRRLATTDAYATAAFAMGSTARDWVERLAGHDALAVCADGSTWSSTGWASRQLISA